MEPVRSFLALEFGLHFKNEIASVIQALQTQHTKVKWINPERAHLTLHFFGNLHTEQIATVKQSMGIITRQCSSLTFGLDNVGVFPSLQRPRIIWIGLKGDIDQLHSLKKKINLFLKEHGFPLDDKKFSPHITIGRVKALNRDYILANELKSAAIHSERAITLKELILYKSVLTPHGPHYTILEAFPFSIPP